MTNNIPRMTKARHATRPVTVAGLRERGGCVVAGLACLVVLVAGVLMDASAGLASDLGDGSGMGGGIFAGLGLIARLFFATGLYIPRGIATSGLTGTGLGLPRRRLGAYGFNYHMLSNGPTDVNHAGATKGPPVSDTNSADVSEPLLQATSALAPVASTQWASTTNRPSEAYTPKKRQSSPDPPLAATTRAPPSRGPRHPARRRSAPRW